MLTLFNLKSMSPEDRESATRTAVYKGRNTLLRGMIRLGFEMDIRDEKGEPLLHQAAFYGNDQTLRLLLDLKPDVNIRCEFGRTPLHKAAFCNHAARVEMLLDEGAEIDALTPKGTTPPLHTALDMEAYDAARVLIARGANLHLLNDLSQNILHVAAAKGGDIELLEDFIGKDVAMEARDKHGTTPAGLAARYNNVDALRALVNHGADLKAADDSGLLPIHIAVRWGALDAVRYLVEECGVPAGQRDQNGRTPMHWALQGGRENIEKYLAQHKARYLVKDKNGQTPFDMFKPIFTHHGERLSALEQRLRNNRIKSVALRRRKGAIPGP